ncbi:MAG: hypothetical protein R6V53_05390 [Candidatus Woesearchaeota archaeon]
MALDCLKCKGRGFCKKKCIFSRPLKKAEVGTDISSVAPAPFIGRVGYPNISVGVLSPPEKREGAWEYDAPKHWAKENYSIPKILDMRTELINSRAKVGVLESNKIVDLVQEVGMASKPVDVDVSLKGPVRFSYKVDSTAAPLGPAGELSNAELTSNPRIPVHVEKVSSDTDLKAFDALDILQKKGYDEHFLMKLLSVGSVGVKKNRKLVPTRWSITAVDDHMGKTLRDEIKDYQQCDYQAFFGGHLGNYYLIMLFPDVWSYELFEVYLPKASWNLGKEIAYSTDHEGHEGRKQYAENCAGGYYACRLPILQKLKSMKRQGMALVYRIITDEYETPMGVWVCREATRKALEEKPIRFSSEELMLRYAELMLSRKFGIRDFTGKSLLLRKRHSQAKLNAFF